MKKFGPGFTLVELLVVASVMMILFVIGIASYTQFNRGQILAQAVLELKNNLRLAQSLATAGEKPTTDLPPCNSLEGYQVTFVTGTLHFYQIQAQCSNGLKGTPRIFNLPAVVKFQTVPSPLLFKVLGKGRGVDLGVEGVGEIGISLAAFGITKTVTVTSTGEIR